VIVGRAGDGIEPDIPIVLGTVIEATEAATSDSSISPGQRVTLRGNHVTRRNYSSSGVATQGLFSHRGFLGGHLIAAEDYAFQSSNLSFSGLASWADSLTGFTKKADATFAISWDHPKPLINVPIERGRLLLGVGCSSEGWREQVFKETVSLNAWFESPLLETVLERDVVYSLQNFLTFATDHPNALSKLEVRRGSDPAADHWITVIGPRTFDDESVSTGLLRYQMLFALSDVQHRLEDIFRKWMELSRRYAAAVDLYFGLQYRPPEYSDFRFQVITQILALYYAELRVRGEEVPSPVGPLCDAVDAFRTTDASERAETLRTLLDSHPLVSVERALMALGSRHWEVFGPLVQEEKDTGPERYTAVVVKILRYVLTRREGSVDLPTGTDYYWRCEQLSFLWKICLLHELGFSSAEQRTLLEHNAKYTHLRDQVLPRLRLGK
jgi:hypothetical protein